MQMIAAYKSHRHSAALLVYPSRLMKKRKEVAITGLEQNTGFEPALSAWKADVLSTNTSSAHAPVFPGCHAVAFGSCRSLDSNQMSRLLRVGGVLTRPVITAYITAGRAHSLPTVYIMFFH